MNALFADGYIGEGGNPPAPNFLNNGGPSPSTVAVATVDSIATFLKLPLCIDIVRSIIGGMVFGCCLEVVPFHY